jgi:6-pyruvoyltetrahydropterin/6-carboxytetrahydropterin synthase
VRNCTSHRCSHSVHGHSYKVEVTLGGQKLDNAMMLYDFGLLKNEVKAFIDSFDHCHVICSADSEDYVKFFQEHNDRWVLVPFNPSAEMFSVFFLRMISFIFEHTKFANGEDAALYVDSVTVHETATGRATADQSDLILWNELWLPNIGFSEGVIKDWPTSLKELFFGKAEYMIKNPKIKQQINLQ